MEDEKCLADYGLSSTLAKAQSPAEVGLALMVDGSFEELEKTPYSNPPELPDVMKPGQESTAQETAWTTTATAFSNWFLILQQMLISKAFKKQQRLLIKKTSVCLFLI